MHSARRNISPLTFSLACATLLISTAGCNSTTKPTPANFSAALNAHFLEHPECLLPDAPHFPYETGDPVQLKQFDALVASQLLTADSEQSIRVSRYTPTPAGVRMAPRFCYGHRVVTSIDSFTPPADANGFHESQVVYHYRIEDLPVWADTAAIRTAFPKMAYATSGTATDKATMADTITGWQVPD
jgi:hypothetical protein